MVIKSLKRVFHAFLILALAFNFSACSLFQSAPQNNSTIASAEMENSKDTASYIMGLQLANEVKEFKQEYNSNDTMILKALRDIIIDSNRQLDAREARKFMERFEEQKEREREQVQSKKEAKTEQTRAEENLEESRAFLKHNLQKDGVKRTSSGLQYRVLEKGKGSSPGPKDKVKVHYKGKLTDGTVFDNSYNRGSPATFKVNEVIKGWQEGLQLMKPGSKYMFYIPPRLGYGKSGAGQKIGPNQALIFTVQLIEVK
jgi:FKBP-type peptidyl-prolyl cis-trans isomerase FklB